MEEPWSVITPMNASVDHLGFTGSVTLEAAFCTLPPGWANLIGLMLGKVQKNLLAVCMFQLSLAITT